MANIITAGNSTNGGTAISTDTSGTLNIVTGSGSGSTAVYADASQNVGIGTSSLVSGNSKLTVSTGVTAQDATTPALQLYNSGAGSNLKYWRITSTTTGSIAFETVNDAYSSASEKMRIDSSGQLFINTTSTPADANTYLGIINAGGSNYGIAIKNSNTSTNQAIGFFNNSGTRIGSVSFTTTATAFNTSSDYRLKENVQPMVGALAKVSQLNPCTYNWKLDGSNGEGFIAHELQAVVPEAVTGEKDAVNEDGSIKPQGIDTSFLVATLTAAIQEQQSMIQELKAELDALKAKVGE
jgi:hypothetical protein